MRTAKEARKSLNFVSTQLKIRLTQASRPTDEPLVPNLDKIRGETTKVEVSLGRQIGSTECVRRLGRVTLIQATSIVLEIGR